MVPLTFGRQGICFVGQCVKKCFLLAWWRDSTEHVILVSSRICSQAQKIPFIADEEVQFVMAPKTRPRVVSLPLASSRFKGKRQASPIIEFEGQERVGHTVNLVKVINNEPYVFDFVCPYVERIIP